MLKLPTNKQQEYLLLIHEYYLVNGYYPVMRELAEINNVSTQAVWCMYKKLFKFKWLEPTEGINKKIKGFTKKGQDFVNSNYSKS